MNRYMIPHNKNDHKRQHDRDMTTAAQLPGLLDEQSLYYIEYSNIYKRNSQKMMVSTIASCFLLLCLFCEVPVSVFADAIKPSSVPGLVEHATTFNMHHDHKQLQKPQPPNQYLWRVGEGQQDPNPAQHQREYHRRRLDLGDFDTINKLFQNQDISIPLGSSPPVISFSDDVAVTVSSLVCSGLSIGDVDIQWQDEDEYEEKCDIAGKKKCGLNYFATQTEIATTLDIVDVNVACTGTFEFGFRGITNVGQGIFNMNMVDSDATVGLVLAIDDDDIGDDTNVFDTFTVPNDETASNQNVYSTSSNQIVGPTHRFFDGVNSVTMASTTTPRTFSHSPPNVMRISSCNAALNVESLTFHLERVDFVENILNSIGMTDRISEFMGTALCRLLQEGGGDKSEDDGTEDLQNVMGDFAALLQPYLPPTTSSSFDPLAAEATLDFPSDMHAVNFMNPTTQLSLILKKLLDEFSSSPSVLHQLLGESLLNEQGEVQIDISSIMSAVSSLRSGLLQQQDDSLLNDFLESGIVEMSTPAGNLTLVLDHIALLLGNSSLADKQLLSIAAVGNYSLQVQLAVENMKIRTGVKFKVVTPAEVEDDSGVPSTKSYDILIVIPIHNMTMQATALILLDEDEILGLSLGDMTKMLNGDGAGSLSILNCLASILYKGELTDLEIGPVDIGALQMTRLETFSPGLARLASTLMDIVYGAYAPSLTRAIPNMIRTKLVSHINSLLDPAKDSIRSAGTTVGGCSSTVALQEYSHDEALIDFRQFLASPTTMGLEQNEVVSSNETSELDFIALHLQGFLRSAGNTNDMITGLLGSTLTMSEGDSGKSIVKDGNLVSVDNRLPVGFTQARVQLKLADLRIQNLDSIGNLSLFVPTPTHGQVLNNSMTLGLPTRPFQVSVSVVFGLTSGSNVIHNEMIVGFDLPVSRLIAQIMLRIQEKRFLSLSIQDIMEFECLLPELLGTPVLDAHGVRIQGDKPSISFHDVDFSMASRSGSGLILECVQCNSPGFQELSELLRQPEEQEAVIQSIESIINLALTSLVEGEASYAQLMVDRYLVSASNKCGGTEVAVEEYRAFESPNTGKTAIDYVLTMIFVLVTVVCVSMAIWSLLRCFVTRRHRKWLATLSNSQLLAVYNEQTKRSEEQSAHSALSMSMFNSEEVPVFAKYFIPIVILGNIGLFLSGHLSIGGSVRVYIKLAGEELVLDDVYVFSISETAVDLWNAGGRVLSAIMFLSSLIWPYAKQLATLVVWFLPPNTLSLQQRGSVLYWLDALAKWSMVDVMIMIVTLSVFAVTISSPSVPFLPDDFYNVGLTVKPMWGLYSNMTAQLVSQVSSHFIVMYQRRIEASAVAKYSATTLEMSKNESTNAVADEHDQLHYNFDQYDEEDPYYRSMTPNDSTDQIDVDVERGMGPTSSTSLSDELDKPDQYNDVDLYLEPVTNGNVCSFDEVPDELSVLRSDANLEHDIEPQSNERQREPDDNHAASVFEPDNDNLDPSKTANDSDLEESTLDIEDHNFKPIFMSSDNVMKPLNDAQIKPVVQSDGEISDSAIESNANDFQAVIDRHEDDVNPVLELHDEILEPICLSADDRPKPSAVESDENLDSATETCEDHVQSSGKFLEPAIESNDGLATPIDSDKPPEPVPEVNDSESLMEQQLDVVSDQYDQQYLDSSTKEPNLNHLEFADKSLEWVLIESIYEDLELPVMKKPSSQYLGSVSIEDLTAINRTDESVAAFIDHRVEKDSAMIEPSENKYSKESAFDTSAGSMTEMVEQGLSEPEFMDAVQLENALLEVVGPEPVIVKPNLGDDEVPMDDAHDYEVTSNESNRRSESDNEFLQPRCYSKRDVLPAACSNSTATNDHNSNVLVEFEPDRKLQLPQQPVVDDSIVCFSTRDLILPDECFYSTSVAALGSDSLDSDYNGNDNDKFSKTMDSAAFMPGKNDDKVVALFQCIFYRAHHTGRHYADDGLVVPPTANHLLISVALASAVLFLAGSILPAFATESQGLVGIVIGLGGSSMVDHGIFSVSKILIEMTEYFNTTKDKIGLWSITIIFVATTVLVPIVLVLLYLVRWFYPMTHKSSRGLGIWMEALEAWQYVEVFVVTILLSVWQLGDISEFLMNKQCDSFESFFATMTHFQILTPQEAQCFKLQPTVEIGTYILLGATILLAILRTWTTLAIRQVQYQQRFCYLTTFKPNTAEDAEMMAEDNAKDATALVNAIAPFPVLFTDQFRWLMVKA